MLAFYIVSALINTLVSFLAGFLVLRGHTKSRLHIMFALFALSVGIASVGSFFWHLSSTTGEALFWVRVFSAGFIMMPVLFLHFVLLFLNRTYRQHQIVLYALYSFAIVFLVLDFTPLFIATVVPHAVLGAVPVLGFAHYIFVALWFFTAVYTLYVMYGEYMRGRKTHRIQLIYMIIGMLVGYIGLVTNFLSWYGFPILHVANILISLHVMAAGYALLRHHLFATKVVATEFLMMILWGVILIKTFFATSVVALIISSVLLVSIVVSGLFLIRSLHREIDIHEETAYLIRHLERANKRLMTIGEQKAEFVSIASHQLRTPLTSIKGYASLILEGSFGELSKSVRQAVEKIYYASQTLVVTVEGFLLVSRIEQGRIMYDFSPLELGGIIKSVIKDLKVFTEKKGVSVQLQIEDGEQYRVLGDYRKIRQVIHNVIHNGIKYTEEGFVRVLITRNRVKGKIVITISDTGLGISHKRSKTLFKKFEGSDSVLGGGVGLYIAREILKAHKGDIWVQSPGEGKGSTFFIELKELEEKKN